MHVCTQYTHTRGTLLIFHISFFIRIFVENAHIRWQCTGYDDFFIAAEWSCALLTTYISFSLMPLDALLILMLQKHRILLMRHLCLL